MSLETEAQNDVLAEAEKINEERMEVMRDLAENVAHRRELERQVREAEKEERRLASVAEKAGWTRRQVQRVVKPPKPQRTSSNQSTSAPTNDQPQSADSSVAANPTNQPT